MGTVWSRILGRVPASRAGRAPELRFALYPLLVWGAKPHSSALEKTWRVLGKERYVCCPSMETLRVEGIGPETFQTTGWESLVL